MTDPISLIALGAAVGGIAGKFTERTWEFAEGWLLERFGSHTAEAQKQAKINAADFVQKLSIRTKELEEKNELIQTKIDTTEKQPQFSSLLQNSILNASQTDDSTKHDILAALISTRLLSDNESTFSLASQLASDAISHSNQRQLRLMALCSFLERSRPRKPLKINDYREWLEIFLNPLLHFEFNEKDPLHLIAIACASYHHGSGKDLHVLLEMKGGVHCIGATFDDLDFYETLDYMWGEGLVGINLTSVGIIVGDLSLNHIIGIEYEMADLE